MNTFSRLFILTAGIAAVSCSTFDAEPVPSRESKEIILTARTESETRSGLASDGIQVLWSAGDQITVFSAGESSVFTSLNAEPARTANFRGSISVITGTDEDEGIDTRIYGLHPARSGATCTDGVLTTALSDIQESPAGSFGDDTFISMGQSASYSMPFYHVCSGLCFTFSEGGYTSVTLTGKGGEPLAGTFSAAFAQDGRPAVQSVSTPRTSVTVTPAGGGTFQPGVPYYLVSLPATFTGGFDITALKGATGGRFETTASMTLNRGRFVSIPNLDTYLTEDPSLAPTWTDPDLPNATFINNGQVQIGVDLNRGGGIFHFSERNTRRNLLNHYDEGRFIQQSYYGNPDGSYWDTRPWMYNPVQGGSWKGDPAYVEVANITDNQIYVVTWPVHWATGELLNTDHRMAETITLHDNYARIDFEFFHQRHKDKVNHAARSQEMPAMFVDWDLSHLVYYAGNAPWTDGPLTSIVPTTQPGPAITNYYVHGAQEQWYAYVDDNGWGIGIFTPGTSDITYYRFGDNSGGGPTAASCSYLAPIRTLSIIDYQESNRLRYTVYLTIGYVDDMRALFKTLR